LGARPPANVIRLIRGPDAGVRSDEGCERAFQKFARRASRLTPASTTEDIDAVFAGATEDSLSDFDTARLVCLIYGYSGVFGKAPITYLGLLAKAFNPQPRKSSQLTLRWQPA
jgi:hypothetical protein